MASTRRRGRHLFRGRHLPPEKATAGDLHKWLLHVWQPWGDGVVSRRAKENRDPSAYRGPAALQLAPVFSCVSTISGGVGASKMLVEDMDGNPVPGNLPLWADSQRRPNQAQSHVELLKHLATSWLVGGQSFVKIMTERAGIPNAVESLPPGEVQVETNPYRFRYQGQVYVPYWQDQPVKDYGDLYGGMNVAGKILHSKWHVIGDRFRGVSPLEIGAPPLRVGLAAEATAELYFASGGLPPSILAIQGNAQDPKQLEEVADHFKEVRRQPDNAWVPLPVEGDVKWLTSFIPPDQAQLLDSRKFTWEAAAALYGIHPQLLGWSGTGTLAGLREVQRHYREFTLTPFLNALAATLSEMLPYGQRVVLRPDHLLRMEPLEQARYDERYTAAGIRKPSEIRKDRGWEPDDEVDELWRKRLTRGGSMSDAGDSDSAHDDGTNMDGQDQGSE